MKSQESRPINPFKPTAGKTPPLLVGRELIRQDFADGLAYGPGSPGRLMRVTGTRGSGKTVMLTDLGNIARDMGWFVIDETASPGLCTRLVAALSPEGPLDQIVVKPEILGVSLGEARFQRDRMPLTLREALDRRLGKTPRDAGVLVTIDEVQAADRADLIAIATACQHAIREEKNVAFVFAGLPEAISDLLNDSVLTFLRRAKAEELGSVATSDAAWALQTGMESSGMRVDNGLVQQAAEATFGYPYMIQLVGYHVWQAAVRRMGEVGTVEKPDVDQGIEAAITGLDVDVIEPALRGLSPTAQSFLAAMAEDDGPSSVADVAARMGKTPAYANTYRTRLIETRLVEPAGWGRLSLTVPYMREYLRMAKQRGLIG